MRRARVDGNEGITWGNRERREGNWEGYCAEKRARRKVAVAEGVRAAETHNECHS